MRFLLLDDYRIAADCLGCDGEPIFGALRLDPATNSVKVHRRDHESVSPVVSTLDTFAEQAAATLLRIRRLNLDALEQAFASYRDGAGRSTRLRWEGSVRSSSLVAIWDNDVRLPLDIQIENGRLVAHAQDAPDRDFDDWDPIDIAMSEFVRAASRTLRARRE